MLRATSDNMSFIERQSSCLNQGRSNSRRGSVSLQSDVGDHQSTATAAQRKPLFQTSLNHSNVFKELVPSPQQQNMQRSLEVHLDDITSTCQMRDFYSVKEVFQRNLYCSITGVLLEIKDQDIVSNFKVSKPLRPSDGDDKDVSDEDLADKPCAFLLRFSTYTPPSTVKSFYQRALPIEDKVTQCSVSDTYIVYVVVQETDDAKAEMHPELQIDRERDIARQTVIVVVDVKHKTEVVLNNPSSMRITAAYIDEGILMLGSNSLAYSVEPKTLFQGQGTFRPDQTSLFREIALPQEIRQNSKIYAFWHTKSQEKVDIFVQSTNSPDISIFIYLTPGGIEKIRMQRKRQSMKRANFSQVDAYKSDEDIPELKLYQVLNLDTDYLRNQRFKKQGSLNMRKSMGSLKPPKSIKVKQEGDSDDSFMESENNSFGDDEDEREAEVELKNQDSSDDEGYNSNEHEDSLDEIDRNLEQLQEPESPMPLTPMLPKQKRKLNHNQGKLNTALSHQFTLNELHEPLISHENNLTHQKSNDDKQPVKIVPFESSSPAKQLYQEQEINITRVKFHRRNTIVFRSDGQIDFIGSNNVVYSSRNIDFTKMKWEPATTAEGLSKRLRNSPTIVDVILDEHDLLLIARDQQVFLFSLDKMTVSKTNIKAEQARLLTYSNRLRLFSDFLVYDNSIIVSHQNMISICDLNARVCKRKSWRHLSPPMTDVSAEDRDTFNNLESRQDPFRVCNLNIRTVKLRELKGFVVPRVMILFNNNIIRMLSQGANLAWVYDQFSTKLVQGEITEVISSKKANSLVLLRHKDTPESAKSDLSVFYFKDSMDDISRWKVLGDLADHQRIVQVSLSNRFMQDFNKQENRPRIAVYDDQTNELVIHQLDTIEDIRSEEQHDKNNMSVFKQSYGRFRPIHKIQGFRMLPTDIVAESGNDSFFYLARQNKIYKCYVSEEAVRLAQREKYTSHINKESQIPDLSDVHKNLELIAAIASRYQKYTAQIEDFRIMTDNGTTYIYASTRSHIYFNQISQFGKLFSGSKLLQPQLGRSCYSLYVDENYGQIAYYSGPFSISVLPILSSNRISLRGVHHEKDPILYQTRGLNNLHVLTKDGEIKTWDTTTGKLKYYTPLDSEQFSGFKRMNFFRNRTLLCRQNQETLNYEYICVEIVSNKCVHQYAKVESSEHMNFYVNSLDNLIFTEHRGQKHNVFEVKRFDKNTGQIMGVERIFNRNIPMNFLSPSFKHYIDIESHTHRIKVLDLKDNLICVLPQHLYKNMCSKRDQFSTETFLNKLIFVEDDFILMELDQSNEIVFQVSTQRTISSFNVLNPNLKFNEKFLPAQFECQVGDDPRNMMLKKEAKNLMLHRQSTAWMTPKQVQQQQLQKEIEKHEYSDPVKARVMNKQELTSARSSAFSFLMLEDFIYLNMKRQRHIHFMDMQATNMVIRDKIMGSVDVDELKTMKLVSVRPFSYAIWKLIEDLSTEKTITTASLSRHQIAAACFTILPDSMGDRARYTYSKTKDPELKAKLNRALDKSTSTPTLLHKLTQRNPDEIKPLIERMSKEWPTLVIPHIYNQEGETPLKTAHKNKHRRVVGWLLDMLKSYPFGYCQYQVSNMIFDILGDGFENKVGEYLNHRFKAQPWTERYPSGALKLNDSGLNQTTVTNWPSRTQNLENKFFDKNFAKVPVQMKVLDCPNLHTFSKQDTQKLYLSLSNCDISIFSFKSIQALIEYSWESTSSVMFWWLYLPFILYLIDYMVFLNFLFSDELETDGEISQYQKIRMIVTQLSLLVLAIYFLQLHVRQMMVHKLHLNANFLWSSADLIPLMANLVSIGISVSNNFEDSTHLELMKLIYAIATLFLFLKLFYYLRYYREIGHLVRLIFNVMYLMRFFFVVFTFFILAFSSAFYAFTGGRHGFLEQAHFVFNITIRKSDTSWFDDGYYSAGLWTTFIATSMFFTYIMLNITVSMVKGYYDANMRIKTESQYQVMTQLTLDCFPYISAPKEEKDLKAPQSTHAFVEDARLMDEERSEFQFKMRRNSFCNQYLLIVETEQEDKSGLLSTDPDQSIKDLQKQVNSGFIGVQKQLQHQDEMLTGQASKSSSSNEPQQSEDFQRAVSQAVDERLLQVQEDHAREISELKEGQQQILRLLQDQISK